MINKVVAPITVGEIFALTTMVQNICLAERRCTPKCPLKERYCKCKFISRPSYLKGLNNFMYNKLADIYPLFAKIRTKCNFTSCSHCVAYNRSESSWGGACLFYSIFSSMLKNINRNNYNAYR